MSSNTSKGTVIAIIAVFALFGIGMILSIRALTGDSLLPAGARLAVVPLRGAIAAEEQFVRRLEAFRRDRGIRGFIIEIESPGGTVGASQSIYEAIRRLRDEDDRPVVAWMGDVGASGGYYAAVAADSVFALPGTITGSIGVVMEFPVAEELYRKVGVEWQVVKSGEHKDMGSTSRMLSTGDREILQAMVDDVHEQFVDAVAENRSLDRGAIAALADGRIFSGRQALELGLIDGLGTFEDAVAATGRMAGLGDRPSLERPREPALRLWDVLLGLTGVEARGLLRTFVPMHSGTPRLLYEWR
ncbi:MAG: signal peptide peptidase SppA [Gemmatimonadota bacterium]|nr:signal peptide peptidase SppA [Gemmatimonadota bacterium]